MLYRGPNGAKRAPTVQSGPDLGPVNLASRSHATFVELSVKLCWEFLEPKAHQAALPSIYSAAP